MESRNSSKKIVEDDFPALSKDTRPKQDERRKTCFLDTEEKMAVNIGDSG